MEDKTIKQLIGICIAAGAAYYLYKKHVEKFAPVTLENGNLTLTGTTELTDQPNGYGKQVDELAEVPNPMPEPDDSVLPLPIDATKGAYADEVVDAPATPVADTDVIAPYDEADDFTDL